MSDEVFSLSVSTSTLEETITSLITTTTINTIMTHEEEETGRNSNSGRSSSYYSTSSASSSAENISTVGSGELFLFTFMGGGSQRSSSMFPASDSTISYHNRSSARSSAPCPSHSHYERSGSGSVDNSYCNCHQRSQRCGEGSCECGRLGCYCSDGGGKGMKRGGESSNGCYDPLDFSQSFRLDGSHKYSYKNNGCGDGGRNNLFQNLVEDLFRIIPNGAEGTLLRSMEKGVLFPVVHWSTKSNENLAHHIQLGHSLIFNQGVYKELKRVIPPDVWLRKDTGSLRGVQHQTWILIGYKSLEKNLDSSLEATWKEWTGVRHIYLNLRHDFEIRKITFLNRVHPEDNLDLFMYLVLMEIGNVDDSNLIWLLDFVQRTRVERMKGFLTVYTEVDQRRIPTIEDEYAKYVNGGRDTNGMRTVPGTESSYTPRYYRNGQSGGNVPTVSASAAQLNGSAEPSQEYGRRVSTPNLVPPKASPASSTSSSSTPASIDDTTMPIVDATMELNGNLKLIEKLLKEIHEPFNNEYF